MNTKTRESLVYISYLLSGLAAIMYQVIWVKKFVLVFGNSTHSVSAVLSAFFIGMALGSMILPKKLFYTSRFNPKEFYVITQILIGFTAMSTIFVFPLVFRFTSLITNDGSNNLLLLIVKFTLSTLVLIIPTTLMGVTFPLLAECTTFSAKEKSKKFSYLYFFNTVGSVLGAFFISFILIELLGFNLSLVVAFLFSICAGILVIFTPSSLFKVKKTKVLLVSKTQINHKKYLWALFVTGIISISLEVIWIRLLIRKLGTATYAFSIILILFLLGVALGSLIYGKYLYRIKEKHLILMVNQFLISLFTIFTGMYFIFHGYSHDEFIPLILIFLCTLQMGIFLPTVIDFLYLENKKIMNVSGRSYAYNTYGNVLGSLIASFALIPLVGSIKSLFLLSFCSVLIGLFFYKKKSKKLLIMGFVLLFISLLLVFVPTFYLNKYYFFFKDKGYEYSYIEDEVSSVIAYKNLSETESGLLIDNVATTKKNSETRFMSHISYALNPEAEDVLIIGLGMGSTFRSSLLHETRTDVVELSPAVTKMIPYFYDDYEEIYSNPLGKIIVNDGRNYIKLTDKKYDIVIIDPPPPFNSSGTTVLYSKQFYEDIVEKLQSGGIVLQWLYFEAREDDVKMAMKSFSDVFPYILVFKSSGAAEGVYMIGSLSPLELSFKNISNLFNDPKVVKDFLELNVVITPTHVMNLYITDRKGLNKFARNSKIIEDNFPGTEYYLIRHFTKKSPKMTMESFYNQIMEVTSFRTAF